MRIKIAARLKQGNRQSIRLVCHPEIGFTFGHTDRILAAFLRRNQVKLFFYLELREVYLVKAPLEPATIAL